MKIVNMLGGLGNQMFVYAMFLSLKAEHPEERILLCRRSYKGYPLHNGFELDKIFNIHAPEANIWQLIRIAYPYFNYKTWQIMRHIFPQRQSMTSGTTQNNFNYYEIARKDNVFYDGYWQNEKNFIHIKDIILRTYSFPVLNDVRNIELAERLMRKRAVSCHVRRGDYLKDPIMYVCTNNYYERAIKQIKHDANPEIYCIFSDDILWCRENLVDIIGNDEEIIFIDWNTGKESFRDMQLMSLCHYNIIANSSFSWWGAWLNSHRDKIVISPEIWMNKHIVNDPICDSWKRISNK